MVVDLKNAAKMLATTPDEPTEEEKEKTSKAAKKIGPKGFSYSLVGGLRRMLQTVVFCFYGS